jgi:hypothetical protein
MLLVVRVYAGRRRFPIGRASLLAIAAVLFVFPLVAAYREVGASSNSYNTHPIERLDSTARRLWADYKYRPVRSLSSIVDTTLERFAGVTALAAMDYHGPHHYPATPGQAVAAYAGALVPRALLPSKADPSSLGREFGSNYGIIAPGTRTSVSMTVVGDLWGTFGLAGLMLGMLLLGLIVRGVGGYFCPRQENHAILAIYAATLGNLLLNYETSVATGLIQTLRAMVITVSVVAIAGGAVRAAENLGVGRGHRSAVGPH